VSGNVGGFERRGDDDDESVALGEAWGVALGEALLALLGMVGVVGMVGMLGTLGVLGMLGVLDDAVTNLSFCFVASSFSSKHSFASARNFSATSREGEAAFF
jgi:hypothetical protein